MYLQALIDGSFFGLLLSLVGVGIALLFGVMKVLNFAHGEFVILGAYLGFFLIGQFSFSIPLATLVAMVIGSVVGVLIRRTIVRGPASQDPLSAVILTFGMGIALLGLMYLFLTGDVRRYRPPITGVWFLGDVAVSRLDVLLAAIALAIYAGLGAILYRTQLGAAMRATAQDRAAAAACGVRVALADDAAFAISTAMAAVAGLLLSLRVSITPEGGSAWLLQAIVVLFLGGVGSIRGALVAGVVVGVMWTAATMGLGGSTGAMVFYLGATGILLLRRGGLVDVEH